MPNATTTEKFKYFPYSELASSEFTNNFIFL